MEIDGYDIIEKISQGPISTVYLGVQRSLQRQVLIKRLNPQWLNEADLLERFRREALICARLKHRNIVDIIDVETHPDNLYLVIEYIDGLNLEHFIKQFHPVPFSLIAYISREILSGLAYAHAQGVIHRDIKPSNIMIGRDGSVKIADFGLAKMADFPNISAHGEVVGTPAYMSPEQVRVSPLDARSDLFSLGITFYELAGQPAPFQGQSIVDSIQKVLNHHPAPLHELREDIPRWYSDLVKQLLAKKIDERPPSAAKILEVPAFETVSTRPGALVKFMEKTGAAATAPFPAEPAPVRLRPPQVEKPHSARHRFTVPAMLLLLAVITAVSLGAFLKGNRSENLNSPPQTPPATSQPGGDSIWSPVGTYELLRENTVPEKMPLAADPASPEKSTAGEKKPPKQTAAPQTRPETPPERPAAQFAGDLSGTPATPDLMAEMPEEVPVSTGYLLVKCFPWAEVYIDGQKRDTTPLQAPLALPAGNHLLELMNPRRPDLSAYRREIFLQPGKTDTIVVNLKARAAGSGYLQLHVTPWAEVYLNGQYRENTPLPAPLMLPSGTYELKLVHPNYPAWRDSIQIRADETLVKRIALRK